MIEKLCWIYTVGLTSRSLLSDHLAAFTYADRSGIIGQVGGILGDLGYLTSAVAVGGLFRKARHRPHGA